MKFKILFGGLFMKRIVSCINKTDRQSRYEAIKSIGGSWGKISQQDAIREIKNNTNSYYVLVAGNEVKVEVRSNGTHEYLRTETDNTTVDNLLSLKECS